MAFIAICYMFVDLFALQHIADRPGDYLLSCVEVDNMTSNLIRHPLPGFEVGTPTMVRSKYRSPLGYGPAIQYSKVSYRIYSRTTKNIAKP